jgi:hypothetical protein
MKSQLIGLLLLYFFIGCKSAYKNMPDKVLKLKPMFSEIGEYGKLPPSSSKDFSLAINFTASIESDVTMFDEQIDSLFTFNIILKNQSDSSIVAEFPFNWNSRFINEPVYFTFEDSLVNKCYLENLSNEPNGSPLHSSQFIIISPNELLTIKGVVFNEKFYVSDNKNECIGLSLQYFYAGENELEGLELIGEKLIKKVEVFSSVYD